MLADPRMRSRKETHHSFVGLREHRQPTIDLMRETCEIGRRSFSTANALPLYGPQQTRNRQWLRYAHCCFDAPFGGCAAWCVEKRKHPGAWAGAPKERLLGGAWDQSRGLREGLVFPVPVLNLSLGLRKLPLRFLIPL